MANTITHQRTLFKVKRQVKVRSCGQKSWILSRDPVRLNAWLFGVLHFTGYIHTYSLRTYLKFRHAFQKPNSWTYNFVEVSGHNLESSQVWGFSIHFLNQRERGSGFLHCKKSWRSSSTPATGDAGPIHTGVKKSFRLPCRKFYYKYRTFSTDFYKCRTSSTELDCLKSNIIDSQIYFPMLYHCATLSYLFPITLKDTKDAAKLYLYSLLFIFTLDKYSNSVSMR